MSGAPLPSVRCLVDGCPQLTATHLGVCEAHWVALPVELRARWQEAWRTSARVSDWTAARRECLHYLRAGSE